MPNNSNRRQVSIRMDQWNKLDAIRTELAIMTGQEVTLTDAIGRAIQCLDDSHRRGAWLSPSEAGPVMAERLKVAVNLILRQLAEGQQPTFDETIINLN